MKGLITMEKKLNATVWNEYVHEERKDEKVIALYPNGIHQAIAEALGDDFKVRCAVMKDEEHGLTAEVLDNTDVLIWWSHIAHHEVNDYIVNRVYHRILGGMGLIALHSSHKSKIFTKLTGTTSRMKFRADNERERIWVTSPGHPIAQGIGEYIEIDEEEMYGEPFDIPQPDELVFVSWFQGGEVCRSGCCYRRGQGNIFYFRPGHETNPTFYHPQIQKVLRNAVYWAAPTSVSNPQFGRAEPLEKF